MTDTPTPPPGPLPPTLSSPLPAPDDRSGSQSTDPSNASGTPYDSISEPATATVLAPDLAITAPPPPPSFPPFPPPGGMLPPLPPGWTEHTSEGASYWYNASTGVSTYTRPLPAFPPPNFYPPFPPPGFPHALPPPSTVPSGSVPSGFVPRLNSTPGLEKKKKKEKPKEKTPIPGTSWTRVKTTEGNVFYTNKETKQSEWVVPDGIKDQVATLEASELAAADEIKAKEEASARQEVERLKTELAAANQAYAENKKRPAPASIPTSPKGNKRAKPSTAEEDAEQAQIDLLSQLHNQNDSDDERMEAGEGNDEDEGEDVGPEDEEAWQRVIAKEMGIEYVSPEDRVKREKEAAEREKKEALEEQTRREEDAKRALYSSVPMPSKVEMTVEEGRALFKSLLYEKDISPVAPWDSSLPLFINDPRYILLSSLKDRKEVFDEYCRDKARQQRAAKAAARLSTVDNPLSSSSAAIPSASEEKKDPEKEYRLLLESEVKSTRTRWEEFRKKWKKDRRFFGWGKDDREREKVFKAHLREVGEKKRRHAEKAEKEFFELLAESKEVQKDSVWKEVKRSLERDPRYDAVGSSSLREELFLTHTRHLASNTQHVPSSTSTRAAPSDSTSATKKERAEASLKEREEKVRAQQGKVQMDIGRSRGLVGREEAEREFGSLLIDKVLEHDTTWEELLPILSRDPRFEHPALTLSTKHQLFSNHLASLHSKRLSSLHSLFLAHSPSLQAPFSSVQPLIYNDPLITARLRLSPAQLEDEYTRWASVREQEAKRDFAELLAENNFVKFWGGMRKARAEEEGERRKAGLEGDGVDSDEEVPEGDEGGGRADLKKMAEGIDLREIEQVLRDRRYRIFDHRPEEREVWVQEYISNMTAPQASIHLGV